MRKTRLVILPTKCLNQMGFLLLFLSCPVIGDWGRIRPDNENLQKAIEVEREGTCGFQRDTPGGLLHFTREKGSNIRRFREDNDFNVLKIARFEERRHLRRLAQNRLDERRERSSEFQRERDTQARTIRSKSPEPRQKDRNDVRARSLSLSRIEALQRQTRRETDFERRDDERRLSLARRMNEKESERRVAQREGERITSVQDMRSSRRRENEKPVQRLSLERREEDRRRQDKSTRRLSLAREEENSRRVEGFENRRTEDRATVERRLSDVRKFRNEGERTVRIKRDVNGRRDVGADAPVVKSEQNVKDERRRDVINRRVDRLDKTRSTFSDTNRQEVQPENTAKGFFTGAKKWLDFENFEPPTIGDWPSNCVIGALAYYLSTRQTKTV